MKAEKIKKQGIHLFIPSTNNEPPPRLRAETPRKPLCTQTSARQAPHVIFAWQMDSFLVIIHNHEQNVKQLTVWAEASGFRLWHFSCKSLDKLLLWVSISASIKWGEENLTHWFYLQIHKKHFQQSLSAVPGLQF